MTTQRKKHVSSMAIAEKRYLLNQFAESWSQHPKLTLSNHLREMMKTKDRFFNHRIAVDTFQHFYECLVEYNEKEGLGGQLQRRVLLRSKLVTKHNGKYVNMCFVVDIDTLVVVTSYPCAVNDSHKTLRQELYTPDLELIK